MMYEIGLGVLLFTTIVLTLVAVVLLVRTRLVVSGDVDLVINDKQTITTSVGTKLLEALEQGGIYLPSGCGGKGTCGQCRVVVLSGGGAILPIELAQVMKREARAGTRLACQVPIKQNMTVRVPDEAFGVEQWQCIVRSNDNVSTMIKELVLELPAGEEITFRAGSYIQITAPPYETVFTDFDIGEIYREEWDRLDLWRYSSTSGGKEARAYSLANYPDENNIITLDIRIAIPPPGADDKVPPGIVSSYLFSLKPGDRVAVSGPFGDFFARDTEKEMIFIGGGAGMAPMRSHILDQLLRLGSRRKIIFGYGARNRRELFYIDDFEALQKEYDNFELFVALSDAIVDKDWTGHTGFIHNVLYEVYLKDHREPEECEYYVCGPPVMLRAALKMLDNLGVDGENIFYDDFGG